MAPVLRNRLQEVAVTDRARLADPVHEAGVPLPDRDELVLRPRRIALVAGRPVHEVGQCGQGLPAQLARGRIEVVPQAAIAQAPEEVRGDRPARGPLFHHLGPIDPVAARDADPSQDETGRGVGDAADALAPAARIGRKGGAFPRLRARAVDLVESIEVDHDVELDAEREEPGQRHQRLRLLPARSGRDHEPDLAPRELRGLLEGAGERRRPLFGETEGGRAAEEADLQRVGGAARAVDAALLDAQRRRLGLRTFVRRLEVECITEIGVDHFDIRAGTLRREAAERIGNRRGDDRFGALLREACEREETAVQEIEGDPRSEFESGAAHHERDRCKEQAGGAAVSSCAALRRTRRFTRRGASPDSRRPPRDGRARGTSRRGPCRSRGSSRRRRRSRRSRARSACSGASAC